MVFDQLLLRPTLLDIDLDAIAHNFSVIRQTAPNCQIMCVLKANAYGHGLIPCGRLFEKLGAHFLGVALVEEGMMLRRAGISIPILIFGGIWGAQIKLFLDYDLDLTASSVSKLEAIEEVASAAGKRARVHLKIDTGMERIGVHYYSADKLFETATKVKWVDVVGMYSHLAKADTPTDKLTRLQLERFLDARERCQQKFKLEIPRLHLANSAGTFLDSQYHLDLVRPGISLYGIQPFSDGVTREPVSQLKPGLSLRSTVVYFKVVKQGAGVSYGHTWNAPTDTRVVTIPIGYGDGYPRALSNKAAAIIRGKRYPLIGSVCMDQVMVDIGSGEAYNGDEVILIGEQGSERISVEQLATLANTIPYEILTALNVRMPRCYRQGGIVRTEQELSV